MNRKKSILLVILTGLATGAAAVILTANGNPANMGFCIACFLRDIAGSLGLHQAAVVQYYRPEIVGLVIGAMLTALLAGEFRAKAGSTPIIRFFLGTGVMIGALVFLGCPLRMVIRMGSGDLNAFVGFAGFAIGILIGIAFLKRGFNLGRAKDIPGPVGTVLPIALVLGLILSLAAPALFFFSEKGPGSMHAAAALSLGIALIVGALAQRSRLCMVGGMRNAVMFGDFELLIGFAGVFAAVLVGNIISGKFGGFSFQKQPIAHSSHLWNLLGMVVVGWGSTLLGGCPLRQLILAGEGNVDSAVTVLGMIAGAAVSHRCGLAGSADSVLEDGTYKIGGISAASRITVICILAALAVLSAANVYFEKKKTEETK